MNILVYVSVVISFWIKSVLCYYENQPKIILENDNIIIEGNYDRNVTLRLAGDSSFFVNDMNVMEKIQHHYKPALEDNNSKETEMLSLDEIKAEVRQLHEDLERFAKRVLSMQNRTRGTAQLEVLRRKTNRLNVRLLILEGRLKRDECAEATEPCKNGGTCSDSYNGFHCECTEAFTGKTCEDDVDECYSLAGTDLGCQNGAICINTYGSYKCNCAKGFTGSHCRLRSAVCHHDQLEELCGHGTCVPANNHQGYTCICDQGWTRNSTALTNRNATTALSCDFDVNECEGTSNPCHSECINLPGSFKCGPCPAGYTGNGVTCLDINECAIDNGGCSLSPKVRCINTEGSYVCGNCPSGWLGDGHTCKLAPSNSCNDEKICHPQARCEYISDVASCTCPPGMFGHGFGPQGCHSNPTVDACENHICQNNGTCISSGRTTSCVCLRGYSGALCETADGCHPNPCQNDGICKPLDLKAFKCSCLPGTTGKQCEVLRSVCGKAMRLPTGEIKYPTDDLNEYSANEKCSWIIRTAPNQILNLTFTKFDVEESEDCTRDWLQIHDGRGLASQLIGRFCGKTLPLGGNILSSDNLLFFWFRSDNATNRPGFQMTWVSQAHVCGENIEVADRQAGLIKSPGYPGKTPRNRECLWKLSAPYGQRFILRIFDVSLGLLPNCTGDVLQLNDADLVLKKYCQPSTAEVLRSSSNQISVHFHTDRFGGDSSFQLHYEVEPGLPHCGGLFTDASAFIVGPSQTATCLYLIQQPPGTQVKWQLRAYPSHGVINCNLHRIEVFNGKTVDDPSLLVSCGGFPPPAVISTTNFMLIKYTNSIANDQNIVHSIRSEYARVCTSQVFGPDPGILSTPNYPKPYVEHITCTFQISGLVNSVVVANFTDFSIADSKTNNGLDLPDVVATFNETNTHSDESITYVDVHLSSKSKHRYYHGAPVVLRSENNQMTIVFHATSNSERARGLRIEYTFESIECGGVYTAKEGSIDTTVEVEQCVIILEAPYGQDIELDLEYTVFSDSRELLIYCNMTGRSDFLLKNLTRSSRIRQIYNHNVLTFILKSGTKLSGSYKFFRNENRACGANFSIPYGSILSPGWPWPYPPNLQCVWRITVPLGHKIELQIFSFILEPSCTGDTLEIRNGQFPDSPLIGRYCGNNIPSRLVSFTNSLYIKFVSDGSVQARGFYLDFVQTTTGCGGKLTSYKGSIHTPHFDTLPETTEIEGVDIVCEWEILVSQGSSINLTVATASDELEFCHKNNLRVYDGRSSQTSLLQFNCSDVMKGNPVQLKSSSNQLLIIYSLAQNSKYVTPEFILDYVTNCNAVIDSYKGAIESPNFPENYPNNQNCVWEIKASRNSKIQVVFSHLSLEVLDIMCEHDYVEIWDIADNFVLKKRRLCTHIPDTIVSEGNRLKIHFVTDYSTSKNGFHLEYTRLGCGAHMYSEDGYITSPNYPYSNDLDCEWFIEVQPGNEIVLNVLEFHIEDENPDCTQNILYFKDSKESSTELARECHVQQKPLTITSTSYRLYIHFLSSPTRSRKYFKASYFTRTASCGGMFSVTSGLITSSNYPYVASPQSYNCDWDIYVPDTYGILLDFKHFELSDSPNCTDASMQFFKNISSSDNLIHLGTFCGTKRPNIQTVHASNLRINYKDNGRQRLGIFAIEYKKQCGGLIAQSSGYIRSLAIEECIWEFDGSQGTRISLNILQMECYCRTTSEGLKVCNNGLGFKENHFDYNLESGNYSMFLCEQHQTDLIFEAVKLHIFANHINFRAKYSTVQHSCGGDITSSMGSLASPYYPSTYPPNIDCTWTLQATNGSFLQLQFDQFDVVKSEHCNEDYLEIRNWYEDKLVGIYCGSQVPQQPLVFYERVWLRFHSAEGNTGKGFKLSWNYALLNELVNMTHGYIANPPLQMVKNFDEPYAWRILVQRGQLVQIVFEEYSSGLKLFDGFDETGLPVNISPSPWRFVSSSNVVYLQTDNEKLQTFLIHWNITTNNPVKANATLNECQTERSIKYTIYISLTNNYFQHGKCEWILKPAKPTEHIAVTLLYMNLRTETNCFFDIFTSADLMSWHAQEQGCHTTLARNSSHISKLIVANQNQWIHGTPYIKLVIYRTGFMAKVAAKCGSNMTDSVGFIDGNSLHERDETKCLWHVSVKAGKRIRVQIDNPQNKTAKEDFRNDCRTYVLIYDGIDEYAPLLMPGKICYPQNVSSILINSTSNHLTIKYNLQESYLHLYPPWNLTYREYNECNEDIRLIPEAPAINITSRLYPNVHHTHRECEWRIVAPLGELIQIEFSADFRMNLLRCSEEYLELFDGFTSLARSLGRYCTNPGIVKTTQNMLYIHYLTDLAEPRGFKASISIAKCGGSYSRDSGIIMSPGYPASYPSFTQCDFAIDLRYRTAIGLTLNDLNLPYNESKLQSSDHLEIITINRANGNTSSIFVYGNTTEKTDLVISSNKAIIRFHTFSKAHNFRGFSLTYYVHGVLCHNTVVGVSGLITIYSASTFYIAEQCTRFITVPKPQRVRLEFLNMDDFNQGMSSGKLQFYIYNDFKRSSQIAAFSSTDFRADAIIQSSQNKMYVVVDLPRGQHLPTLRARYSSEEESPCPRDIDAGDNAGNIDIPGSDPMFKGTYSCAIELKLNEGETMVFNISTLLSTGLEFPLVFKADDALASYYGNLTDIVYVQSVQAGTMHIAQTALSRIQRLQISYRKYACGGQVRVANGVEIKYPKVVTANMGEQVMCVWSLFNIQINEFNLLGNFSFTDSCEHEYVEIVSGEWTNRKSLQRFCRDGHVNYFTYPLTQRYAYIIYNSMHYNPESYAFAFRIEQLLCSSETFVRFKSSSIKIDKSLYRNNVECFWVFYTDPGLYLQVEFQGRFFIEESANCTKDYLDLQRDDAGIWMPEARFCGREVPRVYNVSSNRLKIVFRTDESVIGDGFEFIIKTHCRLVVNVTSTQPQLINIPSTIRNYFASVHCECIFQGNETDKLIVIKAAYKSNMYSDLNCWFDTVTVHKRGANGTELPPIQQCGIYFEERGYQYLRLQYRLTLLPKITIEYAYDTCGGNLTQPDVIRPLRYQTENIDDAKMSCVWFVTAPPDHFVLIRFKRLSLEELHDGPYIYSGHEIKSDKLIEELSGNYSPANPIIVESNRAVIYAVLDGTRFNDGFEADIVFVPNCNERISLTEGNSPLTLSRTIKFNAGEEYICNYRVKASKAYRIKVEIKKLQINSGNLECQNVQAACPDYCNSLEVFDKPIELEEIVDTLCSLSRNRTFTSSSNFAYLRLNAHQPGQYSFEIVFRMEETECGLTEHKLAENEVYKFTFPPNGLERYSANIHCTWQLSASTELELHFTYLDLQNKSQTTGKCLDYVVVKDMFYLHKLCGRSENFYIETIGYIEYNIALTFHSDESVEGKGFEVVVQRSDSCNRTYNYLSKSITYRAYGKEKAFCSDTITVPPNYTLNFYINKMYFKNFDCTKLHLKITDIKTNETLLDRCQNSFRMINLFTTTNSVRIEVDAYGIIALDYAASNRSLMPGCGGTFSANRVQFSSPPYENNKNASECRWDIIVPTTTSKSIEFPAFDMGSTAHCDVDNVKIIEVLPNDTEKLLHTICGHSTQFPIYTNSSHLVIISRTSPDFDGTGWTLIYEHLNHI